MMGRTLQGAAGFDPQLAPQSALRKCSKSLHASGFRRCAVKIATPCCGEDQDGRDSWVREGSDTCVGLPFGASAQRCGRQFGAIRIPLALTPG